MSLLITFFVTTTYADDSVVIFGNYYTFVEQSTDGGPTDEYTTSLGIDSMTWNKLTFHDDQKWSTMTDDIQIKIGKAPGSIQSVVFYTSEVFPSNKLDLSNVLAVQYLWQDNKPEGHLYSRVFTKDAKTGNFEEDVEMRGEVLYWLKCQSIAELVARTNGGVYPNESVQYILKWDGASKPHNYTYFDLIRSWVSSGP